MCTHIAEQLAGHMASCRLEWGLGPYLVRWSRAGAAAGKAKGRATGKVKGARGKGGRKPKVGKAGLLFHVEWHRVVLDEAQSIKNAATLASHASWDLKARMRPAIACTRLDLACMRFATLPYSLSSIGVLTPSKCQQLTFNCSQ